MKQHRSIPAKEEIEQIAPGLSPLLEQIPTAPSPEYFASLQDKVLVRIRKKKTHPLRPLKGRWSSFSLRVAAAGGLLLIAFGGWWFSRSATADDLASLSTETLAFYLDDALLDLDDALLLEYAYDEHSSLSIPGSDDWFIDGDALDEFSDDDFLDDYL